MKKQILSILLTLCMALSLLPVQVLAAVDYTIGADTAVQTAALTLAAGPTGTALTQEKIKNYAHKGSVDGRYYEDGIYLEDGNYYLDEDIYLVGDDASVWPMLISGGSVTLDLNGHVLDLGGRNIAVYPGATLMLTDSAPNVPHKFRVEDSGLWVWDENGDKTVTGGVITGGAGVASNTGSTTGGGVYVSQGTFTMNGGSITGCKANGKDNAVHADGTFDNNTNIERSLLSGISVGHAGTEADPIRISSTAGLEDFRDRVNGTGNYVSQGAKSNLWAELTCDIVLNDGTFDAKGNYTKGASGNFEHQWTPIGTSAYPYSGTFDGNGYTIKGLSVKDQQYAGLFGYVKTDTNYDGSHTFAVKNLTVTGYIGVSSSSAGNVYAGGIIGFARISQPHGSGAESGTVFNCVNRVVINADSTGEGFSDVCAGGIVGGVKMSNYSGGTATMEITNCANHAAITACSENGSAYAGGIAGQIVGNKSTQKINSCFNAGEIRASYGKWSACAGGIIGDAFNGMSAESSVIANCLNVGKVTAVKGSTNAGGIAGKAYTVPISNCCNAGKVDGTSNGGIAGDVSGGAAVSNCCYLEGTAANGAYNFSHREYLKTKAEFADGTVLGLLQNGDGNSPWTTTGYLDAAGMMMPLLSWQTWDAHTHNYEWKHNDTQHWQECACGVIVNRDAHDETDDGDCTTAVKCSVCGATVKAAETAHNWSAWTSNGNDTHTHKCQTPGCTASETKPCSGGTATCTEKAKCTVCGAEYGALNAGSHSALKHFPARAASGTAEGCIEHWYCESCGKYYKDAKATQELTKADTVTARLAAAEKAASSTTADSADPVLWLALLCISGGTAATIVSGKKKHSDG